MDDTSNTQTKNIEEQEEDTRSLVNQISSKKKIYVSDSKVENVKIEETYWDEIKVLFSEFTKVRKPDSFNPVYNGYSDDGVRFSTDLNYFRVYTVNKEEYYKIPVATKKEFNKLIDESIYTSFDFIKQYKGWESVEITYKEETKKIHKWKFDDLAYKMGAKRIVGKVQPEKSKERSDYNFTIKIKGEHYDAKVETMSKDYVKITSGKAVSYYEVTPTLFDYIKEDIFKIEK
ncbi:hypothetical protein [[Clostridium] dakarense]|uniref:hypothetical protein n=1 Tax=Faecalimicrobium dakarense TaxID=1301100 RepID=UPI0004B758C6|nr:hypothetical protein [[Clostridium] dakarense]